MLLETHRTISSLTLVAPQGHPILDENGNPKKKPPPPKPVHYATLHSPQQAWKQRETKILTQPYPARLQSHFATRTTLWASPAASKPELQLPFPTVEKAGPICGFGVRTGSTAHRGDKAAFILRCQKRQRIRGEQRKTHIHAL